MPAHYVFRLDDVCPTMSWKPFERLAQVFITYGIRPILGIVPDNQDTTLRAAPVRSTFWPELQVLCREHRWIVAQHGYQHRYVTADGGLLRLRSRSEFAGLPYAEQLKKIRAGKEILKRNLGLNVTWWMAPAHSFDILTCRALRELNFEYISDGISLYPYRQYGLTWVPHQLWLPQPKRFGLWTIGLHLNTLSESNVQRVIKFIREHREECRNISFTPQATLLNSLYRSYWYPSFRLQKLALRLRQRAVS